jgi:hypothetical protein
MAWEVVRVERRAAKGRANARVASGTLHISRAAMALLGDMSARRNAELMYDLEDGRVGVRFLEKPSSLSVSVRDEREHGKPSGRVAISSKAHMREIFGPEGLAAGSVEYAVSLDDSERNVLVLVKEQAADEQGA